MTTPTETAARYDGIARLEPWRADLALVAEWLAQEIDPAHELRSDRNLRGTLETALRTARTAALEQACRAVCEGCREGWTLLAGHHRDDEGWRHQCTAHPIRALLESER